jgi:hypothetical protein
MQRGTMFRMTSSLAAVSLLVAITDSRASEIGDRLMQGHQCQVIFETTAECIGTIARGAPGYTVTYTPWLGLFTASGHVCNSPNNNTHADPAGAPSGGYVGVWGHAMTFDDSGNVYDINVSSGARGSRVGRIACF